MASLNNISSSDFFAMGSLVCCVTCLGEKIEGEVIAFDYPTKSIVLKQPSTNGKPNTNNIAVVNISYVSELTVLEEGSDQAPELRALSHAKLRKRLHQEIQAKVNMAQASTMGVSPDGQKVFAFIFKTIEQCKWNDKSILVMDEVLINPPYRSEDCVPKDGKEAKALDHIRKIVDKCHKDHGMKQVQGT